MCISSSLTTQLYVCLYIQLVGYSGNRFGTAAPLNIGKLRIGLSIADINGLLCVVVEEYTRPFLEPTWVPFWNFPWIKKNPADKMMYHFCWVMELVVAVMLSCLAFEMF